MAKAIQTYAHISADAAHHAFKAMVETTSEAGVNLVLHGTLVFMLECQLMPEGVKAKRVADVSRGLKQLVTDTKGKGKIGEKMMQVYIITAAKLFDQLSGKNHDKMAAPLPAVRDAKTVAEAIDALRAYVTKAMPAGSVVSINALRRFAGFKTGGSGDKTPVEQRAATAVASAVKAIAAEGSKVKPQAVANAIGGAIGIPLAPEICRKAISLLIEANQYDALKALAAQIDSALDEAARKNELSAKDAAAIAARKQKRHAVQSATTAH